MKIASVCTIFPTRHRPHDGVFVQRRLAALSALAPVRFLKPTPWFPLLRRWRPYQAAVECSPWLPGRSARMFYLPGILKELDGWWLERAIYPALRAWRDAGIIDLIDAHFGYPEGVGCVRAARRLGLPVFVTLRGSEAQYLADPAIGPQLAAALRGCTGVIAVSQCLKGLAEQHGVDPAKVRVIANAVDETVFCPGPKCASRQRLGLPQDRPIIITVGQLIQRKGHDTLLRAFAQLLRKGTEVDLVIVGGPGHEPAHPPRLNALIHELGLKGRVRLAGALPPREVADWLRAADVFALATHREGCCNAVLEALACGLPVVTTPAGDNAAYVEPPRHGFIVPRGDPRALADALEQALRTPWDRAAIVHRVAGGGWPAVARQVLEFFHHRLAAGAAGRGRAAAELANTRQQAHWCGAPS